MSTFVAIMFIYIPSIICTQERSICVDNRMYRCHRRSNEYIPLPLCSGIVTIYIIVVFENDNTECLVFCSEIAGDDDIAIFDDECVVFFFISESIGKLVISYDILDSVIDASYYLSSSIFLFSIHICNRTQGVASDSSSLFRECHESHRICIGSNHCSLSLCTSHDTNSYKCFSYIEFNNGSIFGFFFSREIVATRSTVYWVRYDYWSLSIFFDMYPRGHTFQRLSLFFYFF